MEHEEGGPGLTRGEGIDKAAFTAWFFSAIGLFPRSAIGGGHIFGPLDLTALFSVVGVMFGIIAILRGIELNDGQAKFLGMSSTFLGLFRLLIYPMLGW